MDRKFCGWITIGRLHNHDGEMTNTDDCLSLEFLTTQEGIAAVLSKLTRIERLIRDNHRAEMARLDAETDEIDAALKAITTSDPALAAVVEKARAHVRRLKTAFQVPPTAP